MRFRIIRNHKGRVPVIKLRSRHIFHCNYRDKEHLISTPHENWHNTFTELTHQVHSLLPAPFSPNETDYLHLFFP